MADRPPTKGLAVLGAAPPTRSGTLPTANRKSTAAAQRGPTAKTAGGSSLDPMAQELIVRMRLKFGDVASSITGQEIIAREVLSYIQEAPSRPPKAKEADIAQLEERIRMKLVGGTPSKNALATIKRGEVTDEWLAMWQYDSALEQVKHRMEAEAARVAKQTLKEQLEAQMVELERQRQQEREDEEAYWRQEQATLRKAAEDEEARRQLQRDIMLRIKQERQAQMAEVTNRREAALARQRAEDALEASRTAYDTQSELKQELQHRVAAKMALRELMYENEAHKAAREAAKKLQWEEDAAFQRKWEAILNKQEADRKEQMDRIKRHQAQLQEAADRQGEMKRRWLATPLVERYYKQREDDRAEEEERRVAQQRETARRMAAAQAEQLKEREAERQRMRQEEEAYAASVAAKVRASEEADRARKAALAEQKRRFRSDIEAQLRDVAARRREDARPMNEIERRLNATSLARAERWRATGSLELPDLRSSAPSSTFSRQ